MSRTTGHALLRLTPAQFAAQPAILRVDPDGGGESAWFCPDAATREWFVAACDVGRGQVWTVTELAQWDDGSRTTMAGLIAAAGIALGAVAVEDVAGPRDDRGGMAP